MTGQLALFDGVRLEPTIAMRRGVAYVTQCARCGTLVCVPSSGLAQTAPVCTKRKLGPCSACGHERWWSQRLPVGPFRATDDGAA